MYITPTTPAAALVASWLTMFLVGTELFVLSPLLPMLAADYGVSPSLAGWCVTAFSLTYMATAPLLGYLADQVGRRRVLICSLLVFGAANLLTATNCLPSGRKARLDISGALKKRTSPRCGPPGFFTVVVNSAFLRADVSRGL